MTLNGAPGVLTLDMPVTLALNIMYASLSREAQEDSRLLVTAEGLAAYAEEQMEERRSMVEMAGGEIGG